MHETKKTQSSLRVFLVIILFLNLSNASSCTWLSLIFIIVPNFRRQIKSNVARVANQVLNSYTVRDVRIWDLLCSFLPRGTSLCMEMVTVFDRLLALVKKLRYFRATDNVHGSFIVMLTLNEVIKT